MVAYLSVAASQALIDALTAHVALVDMDGRIVGVNRAWRRFADENGGCLPNHGIGINYLHLLEGVDCGAGQNIQTATLAARAASGLRMILAGEAEKFQLEYPCDSPTERRWFLMTVTPFPDGGTVQAIVAHEDVSQLKLAEERSLSQANELLSTFKSTINAISLFIEKRDPYTAGHQQQVASICAAIADRLGLEERQREGLCLGASIHDIGKISVPAEILAKPGRLNDPEFQIIRQHAQMGYEVLSGIPFPWPIAEMIWQHHERLDGSGYPRGLSKGQICLEARILAVADVFDAITSHRPYRPARYQEAAVQELLSGKNLLYDAGVVEALFDCLKAGVLPCSA